MKKQLTVALGLAVLATPAFATKARLQALGESVDGSFYVNDNRNVWFNPAQINNHKDLVTFEWGGASGAANAAADVDTTSTPNAEGGVYKAMGNLVYGVHLGGASTAGNLIRLSSGVNQTEENNIDLFVGGDTGVKWGANLGYSKSGDDETAADANQSALRARGGVIFGDTQVFGTLNITNEAEDAAGNEFDGKLGYRLGATHAWEGNTLFIDWTSLSGEANVGAGDEDIKTSNLALGIGRVTRLNDKANLFARAQYQRISSENDNATGTVFGAAATGCAAAPGLGCEEYTSSRVPVVIGLEAEATSWLTLRASVAQTIWGSEEDKDNERPIAASTVVNAGATLKFGELSVDGVIGNAANTGVAGDSTDASNGTLRTDALMTRVGMVYRF